MGRNSEIVPPKETSSLLGSPVNTSAANSSTVRYILYTSHAIGQFSEQAWRFTLILFLGGLCQFESLVLVASFGLATSLASFTCGTRMAAFFVDNTWNRRFILQSLVVLQNLTVVVASGAAHFLMIMIIDTDAAPHSFCGLTPLKKHVFRGTTSILLTLLLTASLADLLDKTKRVAIERDWVVVMYVPDPEELQRTNVIMRQIDLVSKVLAPALVGGLVKSDASSLSRAAIYIGILNLLSLCVEYGCSHWIYERVPALQYKTQRTAQSERSTSIVPSAWHDYWRQDVAPAGLGLSLLYWNTLTFGGLMMAYLVWRGMSLSHIGVWKGISAVTGLVGTLAFRQRVSLRIAGMWSILLFLGCVLIGFACLFSTSNVATVVLVAAVCVSRIGLWVFDIAVTQLMQIHVPEDIRGQIGGTQNALNAFFGILMYVLGLVLPDPQEFAFYTLPGCLAVIAASLMYFVGIFENEKFAND